MFVGSTSTCSHTWHSTADTAFWNDMEEMANEAHNAMPVHSMSCQCNECRNFVQVHTAESHPQPTESAHDTKPPSATRSASMNNASASLVAPAKKSTKMPAQAAEDVARKSKPSFTQIYAERINQKADYRRELIHSRDKWKAQEIEEHRQVRLENQVDEFKKSTFAEKTPTSTRVCCF